MGWNTPQTPEFEASPSDLAVAHSVVEVHLPFAPLARSSMLIVRANTNYILRRVLVSASPQLWEYGPLLSFYLILIEACTLTSDQLRDRYKNFFKPQALSEAMCKPYLSPTVSILMARWS